MEKAIRNKNAERIVVGILLNHPDWIIDTMGLKFRHFFDKGHRVIFHLINVLIQENAKTIDSLSIMTRASKMRDAQEVIEASGGFEYIETLRELAREYQKEDMTLHIGEIILCSYKRDQIEQKERFLHMIKEDPNMKIEDINLWLQEEQLSLQAEYTVGNDVRPIGEVFEETWQEIISMRGTDGIVGLPSKIPMVNEYFTYRPGELIVIGARAKYGKSNFGINEAHNLAVVHGVPVAYLDTEMKTRTFLARILAIDSGVAIRRIEDGSYEDNVDEKIRVEMSKERIKEAPIIHKYSYHWSEASVRETALLLQARYGIKILIYDYIKVKNVGGAVKEHSELGNWTIFLKDLAGEMDIPIISFGQLSPHEIRLADSDKINRYASTIAYLLPKDANAINRDGGVQMGGTDYMYVDYNRNGASMEDPSKGINLFYTRFNVTFEQADYQVLNDSYQ